MVFSLNFPRQIRIICVSKMASHWRFLRIHRFQSHHVAPPCTKSQANLQLGMAALASKNGKDVVCTEKRMRIRKLIVAKNITQTHTDHITWKDL